MECAGRIPKYDHASQEFAARNIVSEDGMFFGIASLSKILNGLYAV